MILEIYNKINHLKELLTKNDNCHCCILELMKCQNCKHIICPNCDEKNVKYVKDLYVEIV